MKPIGPLMRGHRLIERMMRLMERELGGISGGKEANPLIIDSAVDFLKTYADRTHHGKEDTLFRDLSGKRLAPSAPMY